jgi:molybdopterin-dependent oxidoreductase alpha subunit
VTRGGGWPAVRYAWTKAREAGGVWPLYKALRSRNACKSCALGMGGQKGGMVNEAGRFPQVCKKSMQAMVGDMQAPIPAEFWRSRGVAELRSLTPRALERCGRLVEPMLFRRGQTHYIANDWSGALDRIAATLKATPPDETFWYASGRSSNEAAFLLHLFARVYGTNTVNNVSYYCHNASSVGLSSVTGSGTATIVLDDIEHADVVFVIGGNPASNHPRLVHTLIHVRRRGGRVVVINPVVETGLVNFGSPGDVRSLLFGSEIASLYVQPHIGGDLALLTGVAKRIDEMGAIDAPFLEQHCTGWPELANRLRSVPWEEICAKSGVSRDEITAIAEVYAGSRNVVFAWTMGITHHTHGVENVQAIANLALMRGMVGRPHAGLLPIRGHSNVQGVGSVGVTPKLKDAIFDRLQSHFGVRLPTAPGLDTMAAMEAAAEGRLKVGFCLGGNLFGSNPDAVFARNALSNLQLLVHVNTKLNTGHANALAAETIILPSLARDEEPQAASQESMFNYVRLSDGGPRRHAGPRSEVEVIAHIAQAVIGNSAPIDWQVMADTRRIREAIAAVVPGFEEIGRIDATKQEFHVGGRTFHAPRFATADGRANLHGHDLPELREDDGMLRLMTIRSEGQFNTVVYEDHDLYRGVEGRDVILLHPQDVERLALRGDQRVTVRSETGSMPKIRVIPFDRIRAGNALMYYPEANVLVGRGVDPRSKTPAFKNVLVRIERDTPATASF